MQLIDSEYIHLETEPNGVVFFSTMTALFQDGQGVRIETASLFAMPCKYLQNARVLKKYQVRRRGNWFIANRLAGEHIMIVICL